jgi:hypothetical protein
MAIEYGFVSDANASVDDIQSLLIEGFGFLREDDFRDFKCMDAQGVQAQVKSEAENSDPHEIFRLNYDDQDFILKPTFSMFFSLSKDEQYESGKINLVRSIVGTMNTFEGNAVFYNNDNHDAPLLIKYGEEVVLSDLGLFPIFVAKPLDDRHVEPRNTEAPDEPCFAARGARE